MNLKSFFSMLLVASVLLPGCAKNTPEISGDPSLKLSKTSLDFTKNGAPQTLKLLANRSWKAQTNAEWITITPSTGSASADSAVISISVEENTGEERVATVLFTTGSASGNLIVNQEGAIAVQYTSVSEFISKADTDNAYKLKGKVSGFSSQYCSFDLTDDTGTIYVYSVENKSEWADKITNNGTVSLKGTYLYHEKSSKHEVVNATILSFEGGAAPISGTPEGDGTLTTPYNPTAAIARAKEAGETPAGPFYIKGFVSSVKNIDPNYGNADFYLTDTKDGNTEPFYCFQTMYIGGEKFTSTDQLKTGDEVIVYGKIYNYKGNTPETESKGAAIIYSLNGKTVVEKEEITGDNLITSGSFEVWNNGKPEKWASFSASNATISQSSDAFEGQYSVCIAGNKDSNKRFHSNAISLKKGTYEFTVHTKGEGKFRLGYTILENGEVNTNKLNYISNPAVAGSEWTKSAERFTLSSDAQVSLIIMNSKEGAGVEILADAVELRTNDGGLGEGGEIEPPVDDPETAEQVTIAEFISKASKLYLKVCGVASGVEVGTASSGKEYVDFDLTDATGSIKVYGLTDASIAAYKDKIKEGSTVTIAGHYSKYGDVHEIVEGVILSVSEGTTPVFNVTPATISVSANATSTEISIGGNVEWSASCGAEWISLGSTSGTGSAKLELTIAANTGDERSAKVTVSTQAEVGTKSFEVTVTQSAPVAGSGFKKVTDLSQIVAGSYIITFEHSELAGASYALTTAAAVKNPAGEVITVTDGVISTTDGAAYVWTFEGNNNDGFTISSNGNYLNSTDGAQGISIAADSASGWKFSNDSNYGLLLKRADISRCLAAYNSSGKVTFRYYTVGTNYKGKLVIYKLED